MIFSLILLIPLPAERGSIGRIALTLYYHIIRKTYPGKRFRVSLFPLLIAFYIHNFPSGNFISIFCTCRGWGLLRTQCFHRVSHRRFDCLETNGNHSDGHCCEGGQHIHPPLHINSIGEIIQPLVHRKPGNWKPYH